MGWSRNNRAWHRQRQLEGERFSVSLLPYGWWGQAPWPSMGRPPLGIQQQLSSYRETVIRQATVAAGSTVHRDDAPTCGVCHKTKFADGCGNLCSYCQTKFCARCGGRVSLRSNTVRDPGGGAAVRRRVSEVPYPHTAGCRCIGIGGSQAFL
ncbi:Regulating synaptic membrane exocytosis protein 2 [Liparis tanakae]|uniref:Regulating synaptic membrane exocytosis protein 2 n=1 Tax=Liparis tanakae TaxID=230148 RepID=A0A4Z2HJK1_9TELE|nr:Regulating synaptic membrane exocytosis protein 2 [Liparis tanakae]